MGLQLATRPGRQHTVNVAVLASSRPAAVELVAVVCCLEIFSGESRLGSDEQVALSPEGEVLTPLPRLAYITSRTVPGSFVRLCVCGKSSI